MVDFYDFLHHVRIGSTQNVSAQANARSYQNQSNIKIVEDKVDSLALICQAMWELLEERGLSSEELAKKIEEIDLRDGEISGKISTVSHCPDCKRKLGKKLNQCFWCGSKIPENNYLGLK